MSSLALVKRYGRCLTSRGRLVANACTVKHATRTFFGLPKLPSFSPNHSNDDHASEQVYKEQKILPYTRQQLYDLVSNVDEYHRFVPYCTESTVLSSVPANDAQEPELEGIAENKQARLTVGFLAFKETYVSEVTCRPYHSVQAIAASGTRTFKTLSTTWRFQQPTTDHALSSSSAIKRVRASHIESSKDTLNHTLLSIELAFAFANPLHSSVSAAFFKQVSAMMVDAFERRCVEVYGQRTI